MGTPSLRLPESLHSRLRDLAEREGISINQLVTLAAAENVAFGAPIPRRPPRGEGEALGQYRA